MKLTAGTAAIALVLTSGVAFADTVKPIPPAPPEVTAAAPSGTRLISFVSSGVQPGSDAAAVFEGPADKDDVHHRTLIVFGTKSGKLVPEFSNDKVIGCSKCTQFHDDPFWPEHVKVTPGHIAIDQFDSGQKPSTTSINFARKGDAWVVTEAEREMVAGGDGAVSKKMLALPASGLAKDMDGQWSVPVVLNTLMVNNKSGKFMFLHRGTSQEQVWESQKSDCTKQDCTILVQQQDGCISLVKDGAGRFFGAGTPDARDKKAAIAKATEACNAAGGQRCEAIRTDCTRGM